MDTPQDKQPEMLERVEALERELSAIKQAIGALPLDSIVLTAGQFRIALQLAETGALQVHLFTPDEAGAWKERASRTWLCAVREKHAPRNFFLMGSGS